MSSDSGRPWKHRESLKSKLGVDWEKSHVWRRSLLMMALVTRNVEWKYSPSGLFRPSRFADKESKAQKGEGVSRPQLIKVARGVNTGLLTRLFPYPS